MAYLGTSADVAHAITEQFGLVPRLDRRQVHAWNLRRTENKLGHAFPSPVEWDADDGPAFVVAQAIAWYQGGVPGPRGKGWETPAERNARRAAGNK